MIYCVEDDNGIRELVVYSLENTGFAAKGFENGKQFFAELNSGELPDLVLLDIMLPGEDGMTILKRLRSDLDSGADDYVTKPFGIMELISRIKAVLRRADGGDSSGDVYLCGDVVLDTKKHAVEAGGREVALTLKEFEVLRLLMKNRGTVITRDVLLERIWGYDFDGETRTVDVHIRTLRQKLGESGSVIKTVRGVGYRIE